MKNQILNLLTIVLISYVSSVTAEVKSDSIKDLSYLQLGMSNDLLQNREKSDKYFSASFLASYYSNVFENRVANKLLIGNNKGYNIYGLEARQSGFTPDNLTKIEVDSTDRPYCGTLTLQYHRYSTNNKDWKFESAFKVGVSGPASLTENVQKGIHEATGSTPPMGWDNQIANSLIIQYFARADKQYLQHKEHFHLGLVAYGETGSFYTYGCLFGEAKIGWFNDEHTSFKGLDGRQGQNSNWQFYMNIAIGSRMVLYDGTLQGGLIPFEASPYTYSWNDYRHITGQAIYQIVMSYKDMELTYTNVVEGNRYFIDDLFSFGDITLSFPIR